MDCHCKTNLNDLVEFCAEGWEPSASLTGRGFGLIEFRDAYGQDCSVQESSNVDPHLWLGVGSCRMHINPDQVRGLISVMQAWLDDDVLPTDAPAAGDGGRR